MGDPILPPTQPLHLESLDLELNVWTGRFDIQIPVHALAKLASEFRPLQTNSAKLEVLIRYQACDDRQYLLPQSESFQLEAPVDVIEVPSIGLHVGHGQREGPSVEYKPHRYE